jgi:glycosyltransferase involved in cell wall biosynthesis
MKKWDSVTIIVSFADFGGAQLAALRLAGGLREAGHNPEVLFLYEKSRIDRPDHAYAALVPKPRLGITGYIGVALKLIRQLREERPKRVLTFLPLAHIFGQTAALLAGTRQRIVSHRTPVNTIGITMRVLDMIAAWAGIYTDVIAVSESVRSSCRHYPVRLRRRTVVVHNGIRGWRPSSLTREEARKRFAVRDDAFALVAVGRLAKQKNYSLMLEIAARVENVQLLIAGDGPMGQELAAAVERAMLGYKVRFLGAVAREDVPDLLRAADLFLQTSTYEGQSNSVLEALESGVPVVAHDIPEQRETIAEEDGAAAGALVPLNDVGAWVAAIENLRDNETAVRRAREIASRRAQMFSYETMIAGFERALAGDAPTRCKF